MLWTQTLEILEKHIPLEIQGALQIRYSQARLFRLYQAVDGAIGCAALT